VDSERFRNISLSCATPALPPEAAIVFTKSNRNSSADRHQRIVDLGWCLLRVTHLQVRSDIASTTRGQSTLKH